MAWQAWHLGTSTCTLRGRHGTWWHGRAFCVAGVALTASGGALGSQWTPRSARLFVWQAWHLATSAFTLRGKRGTYGIWWRARFPVDAAVAADVCVAGVALGDICLHFAWQAWHLATSTSTLRGKRGTYGTGLALVKCLVPSGRRGRRACLRGGRGAWRHLPSLCVAGVALGDICLHFAWQAWHLATWTSTLHGRCNNYGTWWRAWFPVDAAVAGVALGYICLHSAWQAWDLATWTSALRGRRGTWRHRPPVWVAGVALGDIHLGFAWQVCMALGDIRAASESISLKYDFVTHNFVTHNLSHLSLTCNFIAHNFVKHNSFAHNFFTHISLTRNFVTHNFVTHTQSFTHISLTCNFSLTHTHIFVTHNFVTHTHNFVTHTQLFHTQLYATLSQTIFHTQLCHNSSCHTQLFHTHTTLSHTIFRTHTHNSFTHNLSHTTLLHTTLSHTTLHIQPLKLSTLHHLLCPFFFLRAASTTFSDYWMKLTCGVIRSFNFDFYAKSQEMPRETR